MLRLWNFELHYHGDVLNQFRWLNYAIADGREQVQALMTQLLQLSGEGQRAKVLEIGTGSGYQTALLVQMGWQVNTIEIEPHLQARATTWLTDAGYMATGRLHTRLGDGYLGWPSAARFNGIIGEQHSKLAVCGEFSHMTFVSRVLAVTCSPTHIPQPLKEQLALGGRMIIPVGPDLSLSRLLVITYDGTTHSAASTHVCMR